MPSTDLIFTPTPEPTKPTAPPDDFTTPPTTPSTILFLTHSTPHTSTFTIHGPVQTFSSLLPRILTAISTSPRAIDKLNSLRYTTDAWGDRTPNDAFATTGFTRLVVPGYRGSYSVLSVVRQENESVAEALPGPVWVVSAHGAEREWVVGAWVEKGDARRGARECFEGGLKGKEGVWRSEVWDDGPRGVGCGVLLAMFAGERWEVRVRINEQALRRARAGLEDKGVEVGWRV